MSVFRFKQFSILQAESAMKVGTDAMLLGATSETLNPSTILDVGTGTGVVALMLAQRNPNAVIHAVEVDPQSAEECRKNFEISPWTERLTVHMNDFLSFQSDIKFDLIVSNPPYYQTRLENQDDRKSRARHESALPVDKMMERVGALLSDGGEFRVIIPTETLGNWLENAGEAGLFCNDQIDVYGKKNATPKRCILSFRRKSELKTTQNIVIRDINGSYTDQYINLTKDFHFNDLRS